jgi:hypothetical protein
VSEITRYSIHKKKNSGHKRILKNPDRNSFKKKQNKTASRGDKHPTK